MSKNHTSTPASSDAKSTTPRPTLGQELRSKLNWGAGNKPSGSSNVFAGGAGQPAGSEVTAEDIRRLVELAQERHQ
jgi:hypothetical protein